MNEVIKQPTIVPVTLPPGKYWIGDIRSIMEGSRWGIVSEKIKENSGKHSGEIEIDGLTLWYHNLETGEGTAVYDMLKNTLPCSQWPAQDVFWEHSGLIGIVPFDLADYSDGGYLAGATVELPDPVVCLYEGGLFRFKSGNGELIIDTDMHGFPKELDDDDDD